MKWFKHENTFSNPKMERLTYKHGVEGYGFYFSLLELIGSNIEDNNHSDWGFIPEEYDRDFLISKLHMTPEKYDELLKSCIDLKLLKIKENRIFCEQILERCDDYISRVKRNPKNKAKTEVSTKLVRTNTEVSTTLEEEEEREEEKNNIASTESVANVEKIVKELDKGQRIKTEYQALGLEIWSQLGAPVDKKSEFIRVMRDFPRPIVDASFSFAKDFPYAHMKWKMFFQKLNILMKAEKEKQNATK